MARFNTSVGSWHWYGCLALRVLACDHDACKTMLRLLKSTIAEQLSRLAMVARCSVMLELQLQSVDFTALQRKKTVWSSATSPHVSMLPQAYNSPCFKAVFMNVKHVYLPAAPAPGGNAPARELHQQLTHSAAAAQGREDVHMMRTASNPGPMSTFTSDPAFAAGSLQHPA